MRGVDAVILQCPQPLANALDLERELKPFRASLVVFLEPCSYPGDMIVHERGPAFRAVADHFVDCGRRRPAILIYEKANRPKVEAFLSQLQSRGIPTEDCSVIDLPAPPNGAELSEVEKCLEKRFASGVAFDALLCSTDEYAVAAIHWLRRRGLRVPEDVAVAGVNDSPVSRYLDPPLASIARDDAKLCESIVELLFRRLEQLSAPPQRRTVPMQFVWRESAGAKPPNEARTA
jgi:LacI family transcriptional regulator